MSRQSCSLRACRLTSDPLGMSAIGDGVPWHPQHYRRQDWTDQPVANWRTAFCDWSPTVSGIGPEQRGQYNGPDDTPEQPCDRWVTRLPFQNVFVQHFRSRPSPRRREINVESQKIPCARSIRAIQRMLRASQIVNIEPSLCLPSH